MNFDRQPQLPLQKTENNPNTTERKWEQADNITQLVKLLAAGKEAEFTSSEQYGTLLKFDTQGTASAFNHYGEIEVAPDSSLEQSICTIQTAASKLREAMHYIPTDNLQHDFGGEDGLAQAFYRTELAKLYALNSDGGH